MPNQELGSNPTSGTRPNTTKLSVATVGSRNPGGAKNTAAPITQQTAPSDHVPDPDPSKNEAVTTSASNTPRQPAAATSGPRLSEDTRLLLDTLTLSGGISVSGWLKLGGFDDIRLKKVE
ncbi:MAG: hypothetical protein V4599_08890 [Verrucomicrobiota bacterium]